jgi:hypothetical protein
LSTISIEEATGRLRAVEQRKKTAQAQVRMMLAAFFSQRKSGWRV